MRLDKLLPLSEKFGFAPQEVSSGLLPLLGGAERAVFAQIATVDTDENPQVRTIHLRQVDEAKTIGFNTNARSAKWGELLHTPFLSGCYYHEPSVTQYRWSGPVQLADDADDRWLGIRQSMWLITRRDLRLAYWERYTECSGERMAAEPLTRVCPDFVVVICRPTLWDVYEMSAADYANHTRVHHELGDDGWHSSEVSTLDGQP